MTRTHVRVVYAPRMDASEPQRALLAALLDAHPKLLEADDLLAGHGHLRHPEAALRVLVDDGLATRLGDLVGASRAAVRFEALRVSDDQVARLEAEIDEMNSELKPLKSFVLPGGSAASAALHVARTVCRRAEREMVTLAAQEGEPVGAAALKYVNRLSDFLFVAGRYVNDLGKSDVLWVPGQNR